MKHLTLVILMFALNYVSAQVRAGHKTFRVIYIDNSQPSTKDGFTDALVEKLRSEITQCKDTNNRFLIFVSNKSEYVLASDTNEAAKIVDKIFLQHTQYPDNQLKDIAIIKQELANREKEISGARLVFSFYISERLAKSITSSPPYLICFLPKELAEIAGPVNGSAVVNINYPDANHIVNNNEVQNCLNFYKNGQFESTLEFIPKSF